MRKVWIVCAMALLLCGCDKTNTSKVEGAVAQYFDSGYKTDEHNGFMDAYNSLPETDKILVDSYCKRCSVVGIETSDTDKYSVTVVCPDLDSITEVARKDSTGFVNDWLQFTISKSDAEKKEEFVKRYFSQMLDAGGCATKDFVVTVTADSDTVVLPNELSELLRGVILYDYAAVGNDLDGETESVTPEELVADEVSAIPSIGKDGCFVYEEGSARFLVYDISVVSGTDAVTAVRELSTANSTISGNDNCYYIVYKVKNLSNNDAVVYNRFTAISSNDFLLESAMTITGLKSVAELGPGESTELSTFVAGPVDAKIVWCSDGVYGCYELDVAL